MFITITIIPIIMALIARDLALMDFSSALSISPMSLAFLAFKLFIKARTPMQMQKNKEAMLKT